MSFNFYNQKEGGGNVLATKNRPQQTVDQAHQGEGKRKGGGHFLKNYATKSIC
jgi:hypothetical protein